MKPGHIVVSALVVVLGLAAVFVGQDWLDQRSHSSPAPVGPTAVDLLAKKVEESFQAIEMGRMNPVLRFNGAQPIDTRAMPFDPNARVGIIRGSKREEYRIPNQDGDAEAEAVGADAKVEVEVEADPVAAVADDGMRTMSISISDVHGVTGFVLPGDHVDILLTRSGYADILLRNIKVLAIDQRADQPKSGRTATVEVNSIDAQKLTLAQTAGTLSLSLRSAGSVEAATPRRGDFPNDPLRCDYPYGACDAFEIYSDAKEREGEEETAVDLLDKNMEESFQAIENRIIQMGQEFRGTEPIYTEAVPFTPYARGDSPNDPLRCDFPYGPCQKWLKPAHKWFNPG